MSRLDSFIRRIEAQRACLDYAASLVRDVPGPVFELGLGNGRTYDHLRERLPEREIFVFDRQIGAHPDCVPDEAHLVLGDVRGTLTSMRRRADPAALVHCDVGTGDKSRNAALATELAPLIDAVVTVGAIVVSDQSLDEAGWDPLALPDGVAPGRYFMYRAG